MKRARHAWVVVALSVALSVLLLLSTGTAKGASPAIQVVPVTPLPGSTIYNDTPVIIADFVDNTSTVIPSTIQMVVNGIGVAGIQGFFPSSKNITYDVSSLLALHLGLNNVTVKASDQAGNTANYTWNFTVAVAPPKSFSISINPKALLLDVGIGVAIFAGAFGATYAYVRETRRFTFRRYFAIHPVERGYLTLVIPLFAAFIFTLLALSYIFSSPSLPWYAPEAVLVAALWIGLTAYAIDARRQMSRIRMYERAFAQFLFELADALRGGLDPAKAIVELSKTHADILKRPLRVAADGIQIGRPFEEVLQNMARPMGSTLISRYASLIADASTAGGETAVVIHRAAKDMDDFIKIEFERNNQLSLPVAVLYIAYGITLAVLFALLYLAPSLGSVNLGLISSGGSALSGSATSSSVPKLSVPGLRNDFLYLGLIISLGTGAIIGAFTEGKIKYGLLHSLALALATVIAFAIVFP